MHVTCKYNITTWCLTSTEISRLIKDRENEGKGVWRWGKREIIYLSLHCHRQNDFCIKTGNSDESHFNVSLIVRDKVTRQCQQSTTILKRKESRCGIERQLYERRVVWKARVTVDDNSHVLAKYYELLPSSRLFRVQKSNTVRSISEQINPFKRQSRERGRGREGEREREGERGRERVQIT